MRAKPMINNEEQMEILNQDSIFITADRYDYEQALFYHMMMEYMNEKKANVKLIEDIEFEEINEDKVSCNS